MEINLMSDTVTRPTKGMLQAMMEARVGDDVFGNDPSVNLLQKKTARLFGKEDALFFPSGTMANQTAVKLHTQPGDRLFCDQWSHVHNYEGGGVAFNSGVSSCLIDGTRGMFTAQQLEELLMERTDIHIPYPRLVCIENTTNKGGGACWDFEELKKIKEVCKRKKLSLHLDGARLFHALVFRNQDSKSYGKLFDTISICLSKGLGAPVGSLLLGSKKQITKALRIRKILGGAMRQAGYLAAAGIFALDHQVARLREDHQRAKWIGKMLEKCSVVSKVEKIETNIVIFSLLEAVDETQFLQQMKEKNILLMTMGAGKLRMVTHLDFDDEMLEKLGRVLESF